MQQELSISTKQSMDKQQAPIMCCVGFQIFRKDIRRRMAHVYHNWENCMIYLPHNRLTATSATWPVIKMLCIGRLLGRPDFIFRFLLMFTIAL